MEWDDIAEWATRLLAELVAEQARIARLADDSRAANIEEYARVHAAYVAARCLQIEAARGMDARSKRRGVTR